MSATVWGNNSRFRLDFWLAEATFGIFTFLVDVAFWVTFLSHPPRQISPFLLNIT